jgi:predicted XRE-type DNA-binding protein
MVLSFTFLELGAEAMMSGSAWLTPVCLRSAAIAKVVGTKRSSVVSLMALPPIS